MKFCEKCGKEIMDEAVICPGCGCEVKAAKKEKPQAVSYDNCVSNAMTTNIISMILLVVGCLCALLVNVFIGVILCLVAELVAVMPNTKLNKAVKSNLKGTDKKELKAEVKKCQKELKAKYPAFKFSFVLAVISLVCLILFAALGSAMGLI